MEEIMMISTGHRIYLVESRLLSKATQPRKSLESMKSNKKEQPERPPPVDVDGTATGPEEKKRLSRCDWATRPGGPARPTILQTHR
jgi:hypothetical protein